MAQMREKFFGSIARLVCKRPATVLVPVLVFAVIGVALASQLEMHTSRIDLLSSENRAVKSYVDFTDEFGTANNIFFIIDGPSLKTSKRCADALAQEISRHTSYIRDTLHRFDLQHFESKALLYLSPEQLRGVNEYLDDEAELLERLMGAEDLNGVLSVTEELAEKRGEQGFRHPATNFELAALAGLLESLNSYLWEENEGRIELLPTIVSGEMPLGILDDPEGYLVGRDGRTVILLARPNSEKEDSIEFLKPMMEALVEAREKVLVQFPEVSIEMTGLPTFAYGDLRVMESEIPVLSLVALISVIAVFLLFFRHPPEILFAGLTMLLAFACTLGLAKLLIGHLNIISSVFGLTMAGLGIDFGVHFIARFRDERLKTEGFEEAMRSALLGCGPPIAIGAFTTAAAFYLLAVTDFKGLAELGIVAGTGILLCLVLMLVALPALVSLVQRRRTRDKVIAGSGSALPRLLGSLASAVEGHAGGILFAGVSATLLMCYFAPRVSFDYNFLHIQPVTSTSAQNEEILMARTGLSPSFNVVVENDLDSLRKTAENLTALPSVSRVDSAGELIPENQEQRIEAAGRVSERIAKLKTRASSNRRPPDFEEFVGQYEEMREGLETAVDVKALIENDTAVAYIRRSRRAVERFFENYENGDDARLAQRLEEFSADLFSYIDRQMAVLGDGQQLKQIELADLPENVRTRFVGATDKYAAYVFPSQSVWNKAFLDRFNADVLAAAPTATGTTMFAQALLDAAGRALRQCSLFVLAAIVVILLLDFKRVTPALFALLSVVVGVIWMLGIMSIFGLQYNPINITAVPLMLGIGIDNGVHIVHRFREGDGDIRAALITSGRAVTVSSLTTIAGFACLLFSTHRGLISLGQLMVLGVGSCLVASLIVLPATLKTLSAAGIKI
jgi:hopanoid biosynthesis associated RND transporter like protein HpnN